MKITGKKLVASFVLIAMLLSILGQSFYAANNESKDLSNHWAAKLILSLTEKGIIRGYPTKSEIIIKPNSIMTRAEYLSILIKIRPDLKILNEKVKSFKDVKSNDWYKDIIDKSSSNDILEDYTEDNFEPNRPITRAEMARLMLKINNWTTNDLSKTVSSFSDIEKSSWYYEPVMICKSKGVIIGYPDGTFKPHNYALRCEAFALISKYIEKYGIIQGPTDYIPGAVPTLLPTPTLTPVATPTHLNQIPSTVPKTPYVAQPDIRKYKLSIQSPSGGIIAKDISGSYAKGETINISAVANQGYIFCGWKASNGGVFKDQYNINTSFTMPENDTNIVAEFYMESNSLKLDWKDNTQSSSTAFLAGTKLELEVDTEVSSNIIWHIINGTYNKISNNRIEWITPNNKGNYEVVVIATSNNSAKKISRNISVYTQEELDKFNNSLIEDSIYKSLSLQLVQSEDYDGDGVSNIDEKNQNMNPFSKDSDSDGLSDSDEINQYHTNPVNIDTDSDGISDPIEVNKGLNPLNKSSNGTVNDGDLKYSEEINNTKTRLTISGNAEVVYRAALEFYDNEYIENMPGMASKIVNVYTVDGRQDFDSATLEFDYDQSVLMSKGIIEDNLSIYYLNEVSKELELVETRIDKVNKRASAKLTHFSKYLLADKNRVSSDISKCDIVFVIDNSGSMSWNDSDGKRIDVVDDFVNSVTGEFRFGLVKFASQGEVLSMLTNAKDNIISQINTMRGTADGGTAIGLAINNAIPLYNDNSVKKIMVLLTDGEDNDTTTINNAVQSAKEQNIQIFTIGLGSGVNESLLKDVIATPTGGYYYPVSSANLLKSTFIDISSNISISTDIVVSGNTITGNEIANSGFKVLNDGYSFRNLSTIVSPGGTCQGFALSSHLKYNKTLPLSKSSSGSGEDLKPAYNVSNITAYTTGNLFDLKNDKLWEAINKNQQANMVISANGVDWVFNDATATWYNNNGFTFIIKNNHQKPILDINSSGFLGNNWTDEQRQSIYCILWWYNDQTDIIEKIINNLTSKIDLTNKDNFQLLIDKVKGGLPCLLSVRGNGLGHALVTQRIIQSTTDPNTYYIEIYDNNYPAESRYITAIKNKHWWGESYSLSCDYSWAKDYSIYLYTL